MQKIARTLREVASVHERRKDVGALKVTLSWRQHDVRRHGVRKSAEDSLVVMRAKDVRRDCGGEVVAVLVLVRTVAPK